MEVKLDKRYPLEVGIEQAWAVLSDIRATAACMPGAAITEQVDDTHYKGTVRTKVGPAHMQFGGDIEVKALDAATWSMQMMGKGADKSGWCFPVWLMPTVSIPRDFMSRAAKRRRIGTGHASGITSIR